MSGSERTHKHLWAATAAAAAITIFTPLAHAQAQQVSAQTISIQSQNLGDALRILARQTGTQVVFDPSLVAGKHARAVNGALTPERALQLLLSDSGLIYRSTGRDTYTIVAQATEVRPTQTGAIEPAAPDEEEIVITAQKREESIQDVPISIVALGANELSLRGVASVDDLHFSVPGLAIESTGWQRRIQLRGVGNAQGLFSLIGYYLDEAPITTAGVAQLDLDAYDLARVEVLRGPQGTLYGEGSVGGTIRFITRDPQLGRYSLNAATTLQSTHGGENGERVSAAVNLPIGDNFALRLAGSLAHEGGWIDQPASGLEDINGQDRVDLRIKALWQLTPQLTINAAAVSHRNDLSTNIGEDANGDYTQVFSQPTTPRVDDDYDIYTLTVTYDLDGVRLLNTTSAIEQDRNARDFGFLSVSNPGATVNALYFNPYRTISSIFNNEFRLTSTGAERLQWTLGAMYRNAELDLIQRLGFGAASGSLPALNAGNTHTVSRAWAVFGDASYDVTERLKLGGGLRYSEDEQRFGTTALQTGTFESINPRFYAQYALNQDANIYASAARGFRSGGFNAFGRPPYGPEDVWTYEIGYKADLFDHDLRTDIALFHTDYRNYQIVGITSSGFNITSNGGDATIDGIEWQFDWRPSDDWTFGLTGNYVNAEFSEIRVGNAAFAVGDPLPLIPNYQVSVSAQRDFTIFDQSVHARLDYGVTGEMSTRNRSIGVLFQGKSDVINMLSANFGVDLGDHISLSLFGQNLLDDRGYIDPFSFIDNASRTRPRTIGIQLSASFD